MKSRNKKFIHFMRSFSNIDIEIKNISIFKTNDFFLYNTFNMCPCFAKAPLTCASQYMDHSKEKFNVSATVQYSSRRKCPYLCDSERMEVKNMADYDAISMKTGP